MNKIKVLIGIEENYTREKLINCFKYRSDYEVTVYDRNGNNDDADSYNFYWLEYEDLDFENLTRRPRTGDRKVLFNSYCIRKGLIRKAQLAFYLQKYISKKGPSRLLAKFIPPTYVFTLDYLDYIDEALNDLFEVENALKKNVENPKKESKKFILKSSLTNKGAEILIFDTRHQLEAYFKRRVSLNEDEMLDLREWVIQEYVDKPLLLKNYNWRKFHLRVYVLAVGNLRVYVYRDMLALFAYQPYSECTRLDEESELDLSAHITNTCVQMDAIGEDARFGEAEKKRAEAECVKRFWELSFVDEVDEKAFDQELNYEIKNAIYEQIKKCVGELFECFSCEPTVFQPLDSAFELYGFDFIVDRNYQVFFLEANAFPDFKQTGESLNDLIDCLFYQTISLCSDQYFGLYPVCDTDMLSLVFEK